MKLGRKPFDYPPAPKNYPFRLYKAADSFVLATSKQDAIYKTKATEIELVDVLDLISANGHTKTCSILKSLGPTWVCKEGKIFYGSV